LNFSSELRRLVGLVPSVAFPFFVPYFDCSPTISAIAITPDGKQLGACVGFCPDSRLLAWGAEPGNSVHLWDLAASRECSFPSVRLASGWFNLAFHPDSKQLIFATDSGRAKITHVPISLIEKWLCDAFPAVAFEVQGTAE
jgi:hypothetical protein